MRRFRRVSGLIAAWILLVTVSAAAAPMTTEEEVQRRIICQCGCGKVLAICEMQGWAVPAKALIAEKAAAGLSADEIVRYFVAQYGEKVLAAPPKSGFFLTAWITPFAALLLGGALIGWLIRRWVRNGGGEEGVPAGAPLSPAQEALSARFEAELRERA